MGQNKASGTAFVTLTFLGMRLECEADWTADRDGIEVTGLWWGTTELDLGEATADQIAAIEYACATDAAGLVAA